MSMERIFSLSLSLSLSLSKINLFMSILNKVEHCVKYLFFREMYDFLEHFKNKSNLKRENIVSKSQENLVFFWNKILIHVHLILPPKN